MVKSDYEKTDLKRRSEDLSSWYTDVILKAELADYGPAKGSMVIRPYGYAIWEKIKAVFNEWISNEDVGNAYFPMLIPMSLLEKEKEHVEGFSPELAVVTHGGGKELSEPLAVRPTSETVMYEKYKDWIQSWRDLPIKINQWNNVVRWELRTSLFLRTSEFLWQEGHTAHETEGEAMEMTMMALEWYRRIYEEYLALPVISGIKSESEKFAGAKATYAVESLMPDGKALQAATSHNLGQNFSKAFQISFQNKDGKNEYVWQTSWGLSTRSLGGLFLAHGDDHGVILPPKVAPYQVVVIPIYPSKEKEKLEVYVQRVRERLEEKQIRVRVDKRDSVSVGRKYNEWEIKGVPIRLELGEAERVANEISATRRDTGEKLSFSDEDLVDQVDHLLDSVQENLYQNASKMLEENTYETQDYDEFKKIMSQNRGLIKTHWCGQAKCEEKIKEETKATTRVKPLGFEGAKGKCVYCGKSTDEIWYFAQAY